jgi:hypothetical protein
MKILTGLIQQNIPGKQHQIDENCQNLSIEKGGLTVPFFFATI